MHKKGNGMRRAALGRPPNPNKTIGLVIRRRAAEISFPELISIIKSIVQLHKQTHFTRPKNSRNESDALSQTIETKQQIYENLRKIFETYISFTRPRFPMEFSPLSRSTTGCTFSWLTKRRVNRVRSRTRQH